jgi:glucose-6-phosphate isomerase
MPKKQTIVFDHANMWAPAVNGGVPDASRDRVFGPLESVKARLTDGWKSGGIGFFEIPDFKKDLADVKKTAAGVSRAFKDLIVIGIGGSDLGARALLRALAKDGKGMTVRFIGANTDPDEIAALLARVDLRTAALNVISKSGDTIEPMSTFLLLRDRLIKKVGVKNHAAHVIATTDAKSGTMREIADREGYRTLPVPPRIGGRFSALTTVGLFPAACAGIDVDALVAGARFERARFEKSSANESDPLLFAALQCDAARSRNQPITVLMPYADGLRDFGAWFRQLWAESLGKKFDRHGQIVHRGLTPVAALGATDQHSQIQLYNEGPADKTVTFIEVAKFAAALSVPNPFPDIEGVAYMAGHSFEEIIHAERAATALSLAKKGRPNGTITISAVTPESIGGLMFFFMLATAAAAEILDVNAYDQPGVEDGKKMMYAMLGRKGFAS